VQAGKRERCRELFAGCECSECGLQVVRAAHAAMHLPDASMNQNKLKVGSGLARRLAVYRLLYKGDPLPTLKVMRSVHPTRMS
jgi:hypothetical protein